MTKSFLAGLLVSLIAIGPGQPRTAAAQAIALETIASGLPTPVGVVHAGDASGRLFIVLQEGLIAIHDGVRLLPTPFLDVGALVSCCGEGGLLGLAFHPDYADNGLFYINYTDDSGDTVVARYQVSAAPDLADPASASIVLTVAQPFANHNGGQIAFGPDGFLYIGLGDGGSGGDPGDRAQDLSELLGKLLRIDVDGGAPYAVPPDNPFVGVPGARPEIWAYGLRNPWRFSFDRRTGELFIGDVGQSDREEIDLQPAGGPGGENYGWRLMEGSLCFDPPVDCNDGSLFLPILEYSHLEGDCSVTGGFRYRGAGYPQMLGLYFYADFCSGRIWAASEQGGGTWSTTEVLNTTDLFTTFGEDEAGELYIAGQSGGSGIVYRIVPLFPACDIQLSQAAYVDGEVVTADIFKLTNAGPEPVPIEIKTWFDLRDGVTSGHLTAGHDGSIVLPPGFDIDLGPMPLFDVTPLVPLGSYAYNCRLLDPVTGAELVLDVNGFDIQ